MFYALFRSLYIAYCNSWLNPCLRVWAVSGFEAEIQNEWVWSSGEVHRRYRHHFPMIVTIAHSRKFHHSRDSFITDLLLWSWKHYVRFNHNTHFCCIVGYLPAMAKCIIKKFMRVHLPVSERLMAASTKPFPTKITTNRTQRKTSCSVWKTNNVTSQAAVCG